MSDLIAQGLQRKHGKEQIKKKGEAGRMEHTQEEIISKEKGMIRLIKTTRENK